MQLSSQINEPDYGTLLDDMFFDAGGDIPMHALHRAARRGGAGLHPGQAAEGPERHASFDVLAATDYVMPAIEIIDARIEQFDRHTKAMRKVFDTISDNAANAGIVLGGRPVKPDAVDLRWVGALLLQERRDRGDRAWPPPCSTTRPSAWPGWPTSSRLGASAWRPARWCWPARSPGRSPAKPGDTFHADYGPLGRISFRFV